MEARLEDLLNFSFRFAIDNLWWWSLIVQAVSLGFVVLSQKVYMEDEVNLHQ